MLAIERVAQHGLVNKLVMLDVNGFVRFCVNGRIKSLGEKLSSEGKRG